MNTPYVSIYTANGQSEAQLILLLLESAGIPAETIQESYGHTLGLTVGTLGAVEIYVPQTFKTQAQELLTAYAHGDLETNSSDTDQSDLPSTSEKS